MSDPQSLHAGELLVALGLGSNLASGETALDAAQDPRVLALELALRDLDQAPCRVLRTSALHSTQPQGVGAGHGDYLNACAVVATSLPVEALLTFCERCELGHGRTRKGQLAPRPLDIDLLAAWQRASGGRLEPAPRVATRTLELPHPRLAQRAFVLIPLVEIAADLPIFTGVHHEVATPAELLARLTWERGAVGPGPGSPCFPWFRPVG